MSDFVIKKASRESVKPLIGLFGLSAGGKTLTALLLARGLIGAGKLGCVDTEHKRASHYFDVVPGSFDTIDLEPPFSPSRYMAVIDTFERAEYAAVVVDSMTHEWNGEGGYLDMKEAALDKMAGDDWKKREKCNLAAAARMKPEHNKLVARLLRSNMAIILCFRGKDKVRLEKDEENKTKIVKDDHVSPIQESGLIFECLIAGEVFSKEMDRDGKKINVGGFFRCTKHSHHTLWDILPGDNEQLGIKHGELLAKWCSNAGQPSPLNNGIKKGATATTREWMLKQLSAKFDESHVVQYAIDKGLIMPNQGLLDWPLTKVPTTTEGMNLLISSVEAHR